MLYTALVIANSTVHPNAKVITAEFYNYSLVSW